MIAANAPAAEGYIRFQTCPSCGNAYPEAQLDSVDDSPEYLEHNLKAIGSYRPYLDH